MAVTSSSFPRFDRNLNTGGPIAREASGQVALNTVFHDAAPAFSDRPAGGRLMPSSGRTPPAGQQTESGIVVRQERPDAPDAVALIGELDAHLGSLYAVESRHGFSVEKLLKDGVDFFVSRVDERPAGCGGVLIVGQEYAEIKRMYVRPAFAGSGSAASCWTISLPTRASAA